MSFLLSFHFQFLYTKQILIVSFILSRDPTCNIYHMVYKYNENLCFSFHLLSLCLQTHMHTNVRVISFCSDTFSSVAGCAGLCMNSPSCRPKAMFVCGSGYEKSLTYLLNWLSVQDLKESRAKSKPCPSKDSTHFGAVSASVLLMT